MLIEDVSQLGADTILGAAFPAIFQIALACGLLSIFAFRRSNRASLRNAPVSIRPQFPYLSRDAQWSRVSDLLEATIAGANLTRDLQSAAGRQVDAAAYAMQGMLTELSAVMKLPAPAVAEVIPMATTAATAPTPARQRETLAA